MAATNFDLLIEQGATFALVITFKDNGVPVNLQGFSARMQIRATLEAAAALIELTTGNTRIVLGGTSAGFAIGAAAGTINLRISATDTEALTAGRGVYDLELVSGSGIVTRLLQGVATISRNVTR